MVGVSMIDILLHNIVWLRKQYGLSKKEMAKKLEISVWMLNKIEKGELPVSLKIDILFCIYREFGVFMSDLLSAQLDHDGRSEEFD